jgi:hypothetical protein
MLTEAEWLASTDPKPMLDFLRGKGSDRKARLFACACCRRVWPLLLSEIARDALAEVEAYADSLLNVRDFEDVRLAAETAYRRAAEAARRPPMDPDQAPALQAARSAAEAVWYASHPADADSAPALAALAVRLALGEAAADEERRRQCGLLRDVAGNPFRPAAVDPAWLECSGGIVLALAQAAYDERKLPEGTMDPARLAVLADALEEAGCADAAILSHLRGPGPHVRGCWAVDLILDRG